MKLLVTGGAGFIGSCFIIQRINANDIILNIDKLTYSGNLKNLECIEHNKNYEFIHGDIGDESLIKEILIRFDPDFIINFAAETHVDRSIENPDVFVSTNVLATSVLLRCVKEWWQKLCSKEKKDSFRFLHISTDEVYGSLSMKDTAFIENSPYEPNSPYASSKASSDHFVRAFHRTFGLPTLITHCSNNYGPRQFPEKLIPLTIFNAIHGKKISIYGTGSNIRDWIHVEDHCLALYEVLTRGKAGDLYNIGAHCERSNITIVNIICEYLDRVIPRPDGLSYKKQIVFVPDRLGHDLRYAIDNSKIEKELGWSPMYSFERGIEETIQWYLDNPLWIKSVKEKV